MATRLWSRRIIKVCKVNRPRASSGFTSAFVNYPSSPTEHEFSQSVMRYRRPGSDTVLLVFVAALVLYLVLTPLLMLIWNSLKSTPPGIPGPLTFDNFINAYIDPSLYPLVLNSFIYAIGSSLFGFAIAFPMAWLVERTNAPLRNLAFVIAIVATIIPGMIASIAWLMLLHPRIGLINLALIRSFGLSEPPLNIYTMTGMVFIGGLRHVSV